MQLVEDWTGGAIDTLSLISVFVFFCWNNNNEKCNIICYCIIFEHIVTLLNTEYNAIESFYLAIK